MSFKDLATKLKKLSEVHYNMKPAVADALRGLILTQFNNGQDPYGTKWADLKAGGPSHLNQSGATRSSLKVTFNYIGVHISLSYIGTFHHKGWTRQGKGSTRKKRRAAGTIQVARPILSDGKNLPPQWSEVIGREFENAVAIVCRG